MDWKQFTMGIAILIADFFLYRFTKSQMFLDGIAKQSPSDARFSKSRYWTFVISLLIAGIFLIVSSTHLFNF